MQVTDAMVEAARSVPRSAFLRADDWWRAALTAALAEMWRPIEEAEPNQTYLLGWHDWRDHAWCTEVAPAIHGQRFENGYSNVSRHGSATHYMPLPSPPNISARSSAGSEQPPSKRQVAGSNPAERASSSPQKMEG